MSRVQLRSGEFLVELESDEALPELEKRAISLMDSLTSKGPPSQSTGQTDPLSPPASHATLAPELDESINTIVARLKADSGREILRAAAAHITLVDGIAQFTKADWLERAHSANEWKKSYGSQQARDVKRMIDSDEIREKAGGLYSISTKYLDQVRAALNGQ